MKNIDNRKQFEFQVGTEHKTGKPVMMNLIDSPNIFLIPKKKQKVSLNIWVGK